MKSQTKTFSRFVGLFRIAPAVLLILALTPVASWAQTGVASDSSQAQASKAKAASAKKQGAAVKASKRAAQAVQAKETPVEAAMTSRDGRQPETPVAAPVQVTETPVQPVAEAAPSVTKVAVKQVIFEGNKTFSSEVLTAVIANDIGGDMSLQEMKVLAAKVQGYYHDAGYQLTTVVVPQQDFVNMTALRLTVLEGWLGAVQVNGNKRFSSERVADALAANGIKPSSAFTLSTMEQALTRLNRLSGISVTTLLQPGDQAGSTDAVMTVKEADRVKGAIEFNNYGSESTGKARVVPSVELPNLSGRGDVLTALGFASLGGSGSYSARLGYMTPVNARGDRASAYVSHGNVFVGGAFNALDIKGDNTSWGAGFTRDFVKTAQNIYSAEVWLEGIDVNQSILGVTTAEDKIRKLRFSASLDQSGISGRTLASLGVHVGLSDFLGGMPDDSPLSSRAIAKADGNFTKFTLDAARVQRLSPRFTLIPQFSGQYAVNSVVSGEQWGIGGYGSVSGHAISAFSGDSGFTASLEARSLMFLNDDRYQFIARVEQGTVFVKEVFLGQKKQNSLTGALLGFQATPLESLSMRVDFAKPLSAKTEDEFYVYAQARYSY